MTKLHIAMFPWFAMGHITPYLHLANELAAKGHRVSVLLPNKAQIKLQSLNLHKALITFYPITVPQVNGLPSGTETASEIPLQLNSLLCVAMDLTRDQVHDYLLSLKPNFVFYDFAYWVPEITNLLGNNVNSVCYWVLSAATIANAFVPARIIPKNRAITEEDLMNPPPGYPSSKIVLRGLEVRLLLFIISLQVPNDITLHERITTALRNCDTLALRSCREFDANFCDYIASQFNKPVLLTGPVLQAKADTTTSLNEKWTSWLGGFETGSLVFCAFGSQPVLGKDQFQELVLGFELTGFPFLIVLKPPVGCKTIEEALPKGFEERVKGKGLVYGGWVDQPLILKHSSVGCFVSHCGYGSMWESLMSEKQIVLVPFLSDQVMNTRLLVEELKVGVEVKRDENRWFSKEDLSKAIKSVMDKESEVGKLVKENHSNWRQVLVNQDFCGGYITEFVHNLEQLVNSKDLDSHVA